MRHTTLVTTALLSLGLLFAAPHAAFAGSRDFERGFRHELGAIGAHAAVGLGIGLLNEALGGDVHYNSYYASPGYYSYSGHYSSGHYYRPYYGHYSSGHGYYYGSYRSRPHYRGGYSGHGSSHSRHGGHHRGHGRRGHR